MRSSGLLRLPAGVEDADHVCWAYDDDTAFEEAAVRFLTAGLERGDRLMWVGDGAADRLRRAGGPLSRVDDLAGRGALELVDPGEGYTSGGRFSPEDQFTFYDERTRRARAEGYAGLRVVAEVSGLAADREHSAGFLRWEHLADDYVASGSGFTALCAYRCADVPAPVVAAAAAVHPVASVPGAAPPFRLWFETGGDGGARIAVAGEIDLLDAGRFQRLLEDTHAGASGLTLDLSGVGFIDLAGARAVAHVARTVAARGGRLVLTGTSRVFRRMWRVLGFGDLAEVASADGTP